MRLAYKTEAIEQLAHLSPATRIRIVDKMEFFAAQPQPLSFSKPLVGYDAYRFRVGNYRVICDTAGDILTVLLVVKREGAYRNL